MQDVVTIAMLNYASNVRPPISRTMKIATIFVTSHPLWALMAMYATWAVTWAILGHRPRPMIDDPKSLGSTVHVLGSIAMLLLIAWPIHAIPMMALSGVMAHLVGWRTWLVVVLMIAGHVAAFFLLRTDPARIVYWFMD